MRIRFDFNIFGGKKKRLGREKRQGSDFLT